MAVVTGLGTLPHLPCLTVTMPTYTIPANLGWFIAEPTSSGTWTLPRPIGGIAYGSDLWIRNAGPGTITIAPAPGDTLDGPSVVPVGYTCLITIDALQIWRVAFTTPWNAAPLPPISGSTSFSLCLSPFIIGSTSPMDLAGFPWLQTIYGSYISAYIVFAAEVPGPDFTLQFVDGATVLAQQIVTATNTYMLPLVSLPTSNTKLTLRAFRNQTQSLNPRITAATLTLLA